MTPEPVNSTEASDILKPMEEGERHDWRTYEIACRIVGSMPRTQEAKYGLSPVKVSLLPYNCGLIIDISTLKVISLGNFLLFLNKASKHL